MRKYVTVCEAERVGIRVIRVCMLRRADEMNQS